ncbi:MAG: hypothetical protein NTZ05_19370, partial [Chloroflexi bacterium]|nr:hypothetical protein [Chloroflexota bacterium]
MAILEGRFEKPLHVSSWDAYGQEAVETVSRLNMSQFMPRNLDAKAAGHLHWKVVWRKESNPTSTKILNHSSRLNMKRSFRQKPTQRGVGFRDKKRNLSHRAFDLLPLVPAEVFPLWEYQPAAGYPAVSTSPSRLWTFWRSPQD